MLLYTNAALYYTILMIIEKLVKNVEESVSDGRVSIEELGALIEWYNSNGVLAMENANQLDLLTNLGADMVRARTYDSDSDCNEEGAAFDDVGRNFMC